MSDTRPLATPAEVAEYLGTTVVRLARRRFDGNGPKFVKVGKSVRYRWSDVEEWINANTCQSTADRAA